MKMIDVLCVFDGQLGDVLMYLFAAKNTILTGVKSVTVHDDEVTTIGDLSSQV